MDAASRVNGLTGSLRTLTSVADLVAAGILPNEQKHALSAVADMYPVAVTAEIAELIDTADPDDPVARQFVPSTAELDVRSGQLHDPIGDERHSPVKGIVHRYQDRVLLKPTLVCPVYCRFCFRREMVGPGPGQMLSADELNSALAYIAAHPEIREVIVTGGDPLMLSPRRAQDITSRIASLSHVDVIRWHSRVPVAAPSRVTPELVGAMTSGKAAFLVAHVNHPRELSQLAVAALARFIDGGIPVLSQTVLLKGVNDNVETLASLMRMLLAARVKPYYLHHMDLAPGTAHFRTSIADGQALIAGLRARVSGLAIPHYVLDIPGGYSKAMLATPDVQISHGSARVRDADGHFHSYQDL